MVILLRDKQINEATVKELERQRQIFCKSAVIKKRGLHNPILVYEVRVKMNDNIFVYTYCHNFNEVPECINRLGDYSFDNIEVEVYDNYFLEKFL